MKNLLHTTFTNKPEKVKIDIYNELKENYEENIKDQLRITKKSFEEIFIKTWLIETYDNKERLDEYWNNIHMIYDNFLFFD